MITNSTSRPVGGKPQPPKKPGKNVPLYAHPQGYGVQAMRGKTVCFARRCENTKGSQWLA